MGIKFKYPIPHAGQAPKDPTSHVADGGIKRPETTEGKDEEMPSKTHWST
jgi:hypothetical protein